MAGSATTASRVIPLRCPRCGCEDVAVRAQFRGHESYQCLNPACGRASLPLRITRRRVVRAHAPPRMPAPLADPYWAR